MNVEINHQTVEVAPECRTLSQLLAHEGFSGVGNAIAIDNKVVPRTEWSSCELHEGMKIIIIQAVCGG